jgi:predicted N-acetyltransferase YhbS
MNIVYRQQLDAQKILSTQKKTHELWGEDKSLEERFQKLMTLTRYQEGRWLRVVGLENTQGQVLCSLKRYLLHLVNLRGEAVDCIGLGAIFTIPEARRQGLAAQLINHVLKEAHAEGMSCSLLYSDINPSYYEQFGFKRLPAKNYTLQVKATQSVMAPWQMRLASEKDLSWLVHCYEKSWPAGVLRIHRSVESWQFYRLLNGSPNLSDWIFSENDRDLGYFTVVQKADYLWIEEFAIDPSLCSEGVDLLSLYQRVWSTVDALAKKYNLQQVKGWWNEQQRLPSIGCCIEDRKQAIPMVVDFIGWGDVTQSMIPDRFDVSQFTLEQAVMGSMDHF